jgi:hypothetical protein
MSSILLLEDAIRLLKNGLAVSNVHSLPKTIIGTLATIREKTINELKAQIL